MDHDQIEELLAGYVLRSLSGEDADLADRLLIEHVPACPMCRETMAGLEAVAGELALVPQPVPPPDLLLPRLRRALNDVPVARRRRMSLVAAAAGVAVVVGMAALSVSLGTRVTRAETRAGILRDAIAATSEPGSSLVSLPPVTTGSASGMVEISGPSLEHMFLVGTDVVPPADGYVYRLWLGAGGAFTFVSDFVPDEGWVALELTIDPSRYNQLLITEEPIGSRPTQPTGPSRWSASL